jgi:hypothetical protein
MKIFNRMREMPNQTRHETKLSFGKDDNSAMLPINLSREIKFPSRTKSFSLQAVLPTPSNVFSKKI